MRHRARDEVILLSRSTGMTCEELEIMGNWRKVGESCTPWLCCRTHPRSLQSAPPLYYYIPLK